MSFFTSEYIICGQKNYDILHYLLGNMFIRFGLKLLRKTVGISLGTVIVFLLLQIRFLVCYERDFMRSLSDNKMLKELKDDKVISKSAYAKSFLFSGLKYHNVLIHISLTSFYET